jgi:peptidoglycan DL-endopeptidase CwlO
MNRLFESFRLLLCLTAVMMALCMMAGQAAAQLDPDSQSGIEAAVGTGDTDALKTAAYDAAKKAMENQMTPEEAGSLITYLVGNTASALDQDVQAAVKAAVAGVISAAMELAFDAGESVDDAAMSAYQGAIQGVYGAGTDLLLDAETIQQLADAAYGGAVDGVSETAVTISMQEESKNSLIASLSNEALMEPEAFEPAEDPGDEEGLAMPVTPEGETIRDDLVSSPI